MSRRDAGYVRGRGKGRRNRSYNLASWCRDKRSGALGADLTHLGGLANNCFTLPFANYDPASYSFYDVMHKIHVTRSFIRSYRNDHIVDLLLLMRTLSLSNGRATSPMQQKLLVFTAFSLQLQLLVLCVSLVFIFHFFLLLY